MVKDSAPPRGQRRGRVAWRRREVARRGRDRGVDEDCPHPEEKYQEHDWGQDEGQHGAGRAPELQKRLSRERIVLGDPEPESAGRAAGGRRGRRVRLVVGLLLLRLLLRAPAFEGGELHAACRVALHFWYENVYSHYHYLPAAARRQRQWHDWQAPLYEKIYSHHYHYHHQQRQQQRRRQRQRQR